MYDVVFKLNVVGCTAKKSKEATGREFGVATKSIRLCTMVLDYRNRE